MRVYAERNEVFILIESERKIYHKTYTRSQGGMILHIYLRGNLEENNDSDAAIARPAARRQRRSGAIINGIISSLAVTSLCEHARIWKNGCFFKDYQTLSQNDLKKNNIATGLSYHLTTTSIPKSWELEAYSRHCRTLSMIEDDVPTDLRPPHSRDKPDHHWSVAHLYLQLSVGRSYPFPYC